MKLFNNIKRLFARNRPAFHFPFLPRTKGVLERMYDAAMSDLLTADFVASNSSANAEILSSAIRARARARKLERDNPYAWGILNLFQNNVVGDAAFRLQMRVGRLDETGRFIEERQTNQIIEDWWAEVGLPENFTVNRTTSRLEAYLQAVSAMIRDGGILWRIHRGFERNKFLYAVEPIEVDRLDHNYNGKANTGNEVRFGIELDSWGAPVAYWILSRHPGDLGIYGSTSAFRERIPAEDIIALWDIRTRAGQLIGMPRLSSVIRRLHREDQWDIAYVTASIYAAVKQFFLKRSVDSVPGSLADQVGELGHEIETISPGVTRILPPGYEPVVLDPKFPVEAGTAFKRDNLRGIATGSGVAYHMLANDLEGVNFSSGRLGENAARDEFKKLQQHVITNLVRRDFEERLRWALATGKLPFPLERFEEFARAARFIGRRWPYVNPLQDIQADILAIQHGLDSRQRIVSESERGGTFEDVCAEQASDEAIAELYGLDFAESAQSPSEPESDEDGGNVETKPVRPPKKAGGKQTLQ